MPKSHENAAAAEQYARAVLDLAGDNAQGAQLTEELSQIRQAIAQDASFGVFLRDPSIGREERHQVLGRIFRGRVSPLAFNLLGVLNEKGRLYILPDIAEACRRLLDERLGNVQVALTVATPLDPATLDVVRQRVSDALGRNAVVAERVDDSIIGGLVLRVGDRLLDASVRAQLAAMREKLMAAAPGAA